MDSDTKLMRELASAAVQWYADQNDAQLAERIEASCNRFDRSALLLYGKSALGSKATRLKFFPPSELLAWLAWEMNDVGRTMHDIIVSLVDRAGIRYTEGPPGNLLLRFDSEAVYDTFRESLEDEMDSWPAGFGIFHFGVFD
jgi:hypothetical protein